MVAECSSELLCSLCFHGKVFTSTTLAVKCLQCARSSVLRERVRLYSVDGEVFTECSCEMLCFMFSGKGVWLDYISDEVFAVCTQQCSLGKMFASTTLAVKWLLSAVVKCFVSCVFRERCSPLLHWR